VSSPTTARISVLPLVDEGKQGLVSASRFVDLEFESDASLITRLQEGDKDALSLLFRRYARFLHRVGQKILRDSGEADDLVQEVFLYIYRKSALFDGARGSARSWIFQVAYTHAFIQRRRLNSQGHMSAITDSRHESASQTFSGADYDHTVEGLFGRKGWQQILESLTEDQRETLRLYFFEGHTFAEIAERLGQSFFNVRHHYYRGLEKLRKTLPENALNRR